jgi:hypothetical protein
MLLITGNAARKNLQWMESVTCGDLRKLKMILKNKLFLINLIAE